MRGSTLLIGPHFKLRCWHGFTLRNKDAESSLGRNLIRRMSKRPDRSLASGRDTGDSIETFWECRECYTTWYPLRFHAVLPLARLPAVRYLARLFSSQCARIGQIPRKSAGRQGYNMTGRRQGQSGRPTCDVMLYWLAILRRTLNMSLWVWYRPYCQRGERALHRSKDWMKIQKRKKGEAKYGELKVGGMPGAVGGWTDGNDGRGWWGI